MPASFNKENVKDLLIALSQVCSQIKRWTLEFASDSDSDNVESDSETVSSHLSLVISRNMDYFERNCVFKYACSNLSAGSDWKFCWRWPCSWFRS